MNKVTVILKTEDTVGKSLGVVLNPANISISIYQSTISTIRMYFVISGWAVFNLVSVSLEEGNWHIIVTA